MTEVNYTTYGEVDADMRDLLELVTGEHIEELSLADINSFVNGLYKFYNYQEATLEKI